MKNKEMLRRMIGVSMAACLLVICSWLTVPSVVPFTMQTFGVYMVLLTFGPGIGTSAVALYLVMGVVGLPVFSGFRGGVAHLIGPTGGYIVGFLLIGLLCLCFERFTASHPNRKVFVLAVGTVLCYAVGTAWFVMTYSENVSVQAVLVICVWPYVIPDAAKLIGAFFLSRVLQKTLKKLN